jgi:nucleotidyltransferase substrate binding protein (TIGR01987 family)
MEPTSKLKTRIAVLERALGTLQEALEAPKTPMIRDSAIKRFEYVYELSWKCMKTAAQARGLESATPRDAMRAAYQAGLIPDTAPWFEALDARNLTVHTYDETVAERVYSQISQFPAHVGILLNNLKK